MPRSPSLRDFAPCRQQRRCAQRFSNRAFSAISERQHFDSFDLPTVVLGKAIAKQDTVLGLNGAAQAVADRIALELNASEKDRLNATAKASVSYAVLRHFHAAGSMTMVATDSLRRELGGRGFARLGRWTRGVDTEVFNPANPAELDLPRPIFVTVGRVPPLPQHTGPGEAPALCGPTCSMPPRSTQPMLPPPAPMLRTSTEGNPVMWSCPARSTLVSRVQGMAPLRIKLTS